MPWLILALSFFLAGCRQNHDEGLTRQIPGAWRQELKSYTNMLTVVPDGTFAFSRFTTNVQTTFTNTGTWKIEGGWMVMTATNKIGEHPLPLGELFKGKVIHLDDHTWTFEMDNGTTNSFKR